MILVNSYLKLIKYMFKVPSFSAAKNNEELLDHILSLGAHPDVVDFKGRAAIMKAAELGNVECFEKLAHAQANMKLKDTEGKGQHQQFYINIRLITILHSSALRKYICNTIFIQL